MATWQLAESVITDENGRFVIDMRACLPVSVEAVGTRDAALIDKAGDKTDLLFFIEAEKWRDMGFFGGENRKAFKHDLASRRASGGLLSCFD